MQHGANRATQNNQNTVSSSNMADEPSMHSVAPTHRHRAEMEHDDEHSSKNKPAHTNSDTDKRNAEQIEQQLHVPK